MFEFVTVAQDEREQVTNGVQGEAQRAPSARSECCPREQVMNGVQGEVTSSSTRGWPWREQVTNGVQAKWHVVPANDVVGIHA